MIRVDVIETAEPDVQALEDLKLYAAVTNPLQERLLLSALKRAFMMVQRYADVCLLPGKYAVKADEHTGLVKTYMGGKAVMVLDGKGVPMSFSQRGSEVYVGTENYVEVQFVTMPNEADYERLYPVVLKYATGIYDGLGLVELNQILKEC